jgi:hypothetical protein
MHHLQRSVFILLTILFVFSLNLANAQDHEVNWEAFSKNLVKALATDNEGLQLSAMGMIIRYSDRLDVDDAVFDIIRVYRLNKNHRIRILAMITLHKIQNDWAMYYLRRSMEFETDERVQKQCFRILNTYYANLEKLEEQKKQDELLASDK